MKRRLNHILAHHTKQSVEKIEHDTERDNFMSSQAAVDYGLIDTVLERRAELGTPKDSGGGK